MNANDAAIFSYTAVHGQDADVRLDSRDPHVRLMTWTKEQPEHAQLMVGILRAWATSPMPDDDLAEMLFDAEVIDGDADGESVRAHLLAEADMIDAELAR